MGETDKARPGKADQRGDFGKFQDKQQPGQQAKIQEQSQENTKTGAPQERRTGGRVEDAGESGSGRGSQLPPSRDE